MRRTLALGALVVWGCQERDPLTWVDCEAEPESEFCVETDSDSEVSVGGVGEDTGETGAAAEIVLTSPTVTPSPLFNDSTARCASVGTAPDGSSVVVSYAWSNETTRVGLGTLPELALTPAAASPGDTLRCTASASEGGQTATELVEVEVGNRAPVVTTPTIDPSAMVFDDTTLTCTATASDPDETMPTLTYAWTNESRGTSLGPGASVTLRAGTAGPGDVVRCTATASDGSLEARDHEEVEVRERFDPGSSLADPHLGTLRYIPAGSFTMGCEVGRDEVWGLTCSPPDPSPVARELPTRGVTLTQSLWMMESEVTQAQWTGLGYANPSSFSGSTKPVERVSWWEALEAANQASRREGLAVCYALTGCSGRVGDDWVCTGVTVTASSGHPKDCEGWRLPTEAEWEYAARAGTGFPYAGGTSVDQVAWWSGNTGSSGTPTHGTQPVCTTPTPRNAWGLCDMSGNVWEWVWDWDAETYSGAATMDPTGPASGSDRVCRGGSWVSSAQGPRIASRNRRAPDATGPDRGFRLVRSVR